MYRIVSVDDVVEVENEDIDNRVENEDALWWRRRNMEETF